MKPAEATERKLFLQCAGTRGDVQPFVGLALGLQKAGFVVQLGVPLCSVQFAKNLGVDAVGTQADVEAFMNTPDMKTLSARTDTLGIAQFGYKAASWQKANFPDVLRMMLEAIDAFQPDVMLACGEITYQEVLAIAGARGIPCIQAYLKWYYPSKHKSSPAGEPGWMHGAMKLALKAGTGVERGFKNPALLEQLPACAPFLQQSGGEFVHNYEHPLAPVLIGHSGYLNQIQDDWTQDMKDALRLCGFWVVDKDAQTDVLSKGPALTEKGDGTREKQFGGKNDFGGNSYHTVEAFLEQGEPPVYMGWGSMICGSPEHMTCVAVRSLMEANLRGIIVGSWAKLDASMLKGHSDSEAMEAYVVRNVLFAESAPHELLFPKCSVLVHHGGLGTLAAGFRSGVPQVITPVFIDQPVNATVLQESGCGIKAPSLGKVKPAELAEALKTCISDEHIKATAREMGRNISAEDGVATAVEIIDQWVIGELDTGNWRRGFERRRKLIEEARTKFFFQTKFARD